MNGPQIKILLVEDNPGDARLIQGALAEAGAAQFELAHCQRLGDALERLDREPYDVILLDLSLPDGHGIDTLVRAHEQAPGVPIVVLTGLDDETLALKTLQTGAQDYLIKGQVESDLLVRSIRYAIERQRLLAELRALSLVDELTGLYNRRGFSILAQQQLKIADRTRRGMLLLFVDLDSLKMINDTLGHRQGDLVLKEAANILKATFRESDIIARIGGDEFTVLNIETPWSRAEAITAHLHEVVEAHNSLANGSCELSMSVGMAWYDPDQPCSIDELLARADASMYEQKRVKRR
ncbi:MAG: diguanylate cyclase [Chloroflexi bacterium]|nr:diguanylate cyclase [Chloroflexota bacterium]